MKVRTIDFVREFTDCPGGRLRIHGDHSGEEFRDDILRPALNEHDRVILKMNGAIGFPPSFIDEVFGTLAKELGRENLCSRLIIDLTDDPLATRELDKCFNAHKV